MLKPTVNTSTRSTILRFGPFELDIDAEQLRKDGRTVRLQPQPFKLLCLLVEHRERLVTREEIRGALWSGETFVDFEQGVNFAIKQVREALGDDADHSVYIRTVPKRGYRFVAPVEGAPPRFEPFRRLTDLNLHKLLWANIAELKLAEDRRRQRRRIAALALGALAVAAAVVILIKYL